MTVESGTTVRLTCTQESKETTDITYTWSREGGIPLPDGVQVNNGVCVCVCGVCGCGCGCGCVSRLYDHNILSIAISPLFLSFLSLLPFSTGVLEIVAADEGDSGVYICTANGVSATFTLTIEGSPSDGTYISLPMH